MAATAGTDPPDRRTRSRFRRENIGAEDTGHQRTDDQQRWRTPSGDEIVIEFFDPTAGVITDGNINEEANQYCAGIDVHFYSSFLCGVAEHIKMTYFRVEN